MPMSIAVCIPAWKRHKLTEKIVGYYMGLQEIVDLELILGLSEDVPYDTSGCTVIHTPNEPLSAKFNDIIEGSIGYDGAMIVGSDNIVHPGYFAWLEKERPVFAELQSCYYFEQETGDMLLHWRGMVGAGKYMSRGMLERCAYRPYAEDLNRNVDGGPRRWVSQGEVSRLATQRWIIDVKTPEENMWSFDHIREKYTNIENAKAEAVFPTFGLDVNDWLI